MANDTKGSDHVLNYVLSNQMFEELWKPQQISVRIVGVLATIEASTTRKQLVGITAQASVTPTTLSGRLVLREIWIGVL